MAELLERHEGPELHEGEASMHETSTLDQVPLTIPEEWVRDHPEDIGEQRPPIRWMRWLAVAGVAAAGTIVAVLAAGGDTSDTLTESDPIVEGDWDHLMLPPAVEGDWDHLVLPPGASDPVSVVAVEGDWDHLVLPPVAEGDWNHLLLP